MTAPIPHSQVERWLQEDLGHHDVTNQVTGDTRGRLVANESGIIAGIEAASAVFEHLGLDPDCPVDSGAPVEEGDVVLCVEGPASDVLRGERVAVNVAGHASGIASRTKATVDAVREVSDSVRVAATRKTTPGLRGIEKRAVFAGGGDTHRLDLSHMVMVKDNHIAELGLEDAIQHFDDRTSFATKIEVEVETPDDGRRAAEAGADVVMFDNLPPDAVKDGVTRLPSGTLSEASGGITLETVRDYAATGVDIISMGSLTHSAPSLDFSFRTDGGSSTGGSARKENRQ